MVLLQNVADQLGAEVTARKYLGRQRRQNRTAARQFITRPQVTRVLAFDLQVLDHERLVALEDGLGRQVGRVQRGKAIIILNPADPPLMMRNTVFCLAADADPKVIARSVNQMVAEVQTYVPGYRLKQEVQFEELTNARPARIEGVGVFTQGLKVVMFLEIEGAGHCAMLERHEEFNRLMEEFAREVLGARRETVTA